jgi:hypothetical protein
VFDFLFCLEKYLDLLEIIHGNKAYQGFTGPYKASKAHKAIWDKY